jgi:branched-chain amino acid transport system permease protein
MSNVGTNSQKLSGSRKGLARGGAVVVGLIILLVLPLIFTAYTVGHLSLILTFGVATLGMNLLMGYTGMISLGHSAFFAAGAYTSAVLMLHAEWPFALTVVASAIITFAVGYVIGFPAQRLSGLHFAVITLGAAFLVAPILKRGGPDSLFGGATGIQVPRLTPTPFGLATDQWVYYVCLAVAVVAVAFVAHVVTGPVGRAMLAIKEAPIAAEAMGVNVAQLKVVVFALASMLAGLAGSMYAYGVGYVAPDSFAFHLTVLFLAAAVVGGVRSIFGAMLGAVVVVMVPVIATDINPALSNVIFGAALIACILLMPTGIMGVVRRFTRRRAGQSTGEPGPDAPASTPAVAEAAVVR